MSNPRSLLQALHTSDLEELIVPKWRAEAAAHVIVAQRHQRNSQGASATPSGQRVGADAIPLQSFVDILEPILRKASADDVVAGTHTHSLRDQLHDMATVVDVCGCGLVTWSAFTAYLLDTALLSGTNASNRWTIDKSLCDKYANDLNRGGAQNEGCSRTIPLSGTPPLPATAVRAQFHERRKEAVLLWDEDALDFAPILEAVDPSATDSGKGDVVARNELLAVLRRPRHKAPGDKKSSSGRASKREATPQAPPPTLFAMTPFLLSYDPTAEVVDTVQRLEDVVGTPFIAAFTRGGKMFAVHRLTRRFEPTVPVISLESSVTAVTCAQRQGFGRSVPGLPAFTSFLAVATASLRLHIISCRSFSVRVAHHLPEPILALTYCGMRHILFGGTSSGCVVLWAVSEKGCCTMLARWQCQPSVLPFTTNGSGLKSVVALTIETAPLLAEVDALSDGSAPPLVENNMMLIGYHDGSLVQLNLALLPPLLALRPAVRDWRKSQEAGAVDVPLRALVEHDNSGDEQAAAAAGKRRALHFRPRQQQRKSQAPPSSPASATAATDGEDDPEAAAESLVFLGYSRALGQLVSVASSGTVTLFPKDFPTAPHSVFQDPSRRLEDRIMFASLDTDGTAIVLCDYSTNLSVVSLVSLTITWKRHLQLSVVEGLAQRGRVGVMGENPLHSVPRCFCGMSLSIGGTTGVNILLINTGHGCCVVLLDSASDPSSGAVFAKDSDDLLICERLSKNPELLVMSSPHQFCLYNTTIMDRARFLSLDASPEALVHPAVRRALRARHAPLRMTSMAVSLDGLRLYVGCGGCVTVARLDTGRALWRFGISDALDANNASTTGQFPCTITSIVCGGIGNVPHSTFLCLTSRMQLVQCTYEPHVYDEFRVYPPVRIISLLGAPRTSLISPLSAHVDTLQRLPGRAKAYWYVSADGRMSFSRWDVKLGEWTHDWVTTTGGAAKTAGSPFAHVVKYASAAHGVTNALTTTNASPPPPLCALRADDSAYTSKLLAPLPLMCVGTLQGELLLIVTRPHPQRGECVARWRQQNRHYHAVIHSTTNSDEVPDNDHNKVMLSDADEPPKSPPQPRHATSSSSSSLQQPAITSVQFVPPFSLYVFDAKGAMSLWNIADVVLQLRCGSVLDSDRSALTGTSKRCFVHPVPRPPIVRFVGVDFVDEAATITQSFYNAANATLVVVDTNSCVSSRSLMLGGVVAQAARNHPLDHAVDENSITRLLRRVRAAVHVMRATWRLSKSFQETQPSSDASSMMEASFLQQSILRGGGATITAFADARAVIVALPASLAHLASSYQYANHRTQSLRDVQRWDCTFDHEGEAATTSPHITKALESSGPLGLKGHGGGYSPTLEHRSPVSRAKERFQQAAGVALEVSRSEGGWNPIGTSSPKAAAPTERRLTFKLRQTVVSEQLRRNATNASVAVTSDPSQAQHDTATGMVELLPVRSAIDLQRQRECFGFNPKTDPSYHTMKRQVAYMGLSRPTRMALALTFVPRIVHPEQVSVPSNSSNTMSSSLNASMSPSGGHHPTASSVVADLRKSWTPFCSLKDEVETAVPPHATTLHVRRTDTVIPFANRRVLTADEAPRSLRQPHSMVRPASAGPSLSRRVGGSSGAPQPTAAGARKVGFVTIPASSAQQAHARPQTPISSGERTHIHFV